MLKFFIFFSFFLLRIDGHGYLFEPVARSSAWLVDSSFRQCCTWPNHMEMFCGGLGHQWNVNDGKCSICGEAYDKQVKLFEKGGAMYKGTIVKTYIQGQEIDVKVMLTANHKGYFEFRLCSLDASPLADASQECLDHHQLLIAETNSTKFDDVNKYGSEMITVRVQLPPNVACEHCVFQWKYTAGNSWGKDPATGQSGAGLGRENETFMGCSDIAILPNGSPTEPPMVIIPTTPASTTTKSTTHWSSPSSSTTRPTSQWPGSSTASQWPGSSTVSHWPGSSAASHWPGSSTASQWPGSSTASQWPGSSTASQWPGSSTASQWPGSSITDKWPTSSTAQSTATWTWPSLSSQDSSSSTIMTSTRRPLGLTTWSSNFFEYQAGDEVIYDDVKYRCLVSHRSFPGAEPSPFTWAWWTPVTEEENILE